jgi:hypothetical protein
VRLVQLPGVGLVIPRPLSTAVLLELIGLARSWRWSPAANDQHRPTGTSSRRPGSSGTTQHAPHGQTSSSQHPMR